MTWEQQQAMLEWEQFVRENGVMLFGLAVFIILLLICYVVFSVLVKPDKKSGPNTQSIIFLEPNDESIGKREFT